MSPVLSLLGMGKWRWWNTSFKVPPVALIARMRMEGLHFTMLAGKCFEMKPRMYLCQLVSA